MAVGFGDTNWMIWDSSSFCEFLHAEGAGTCAFPDQGESEYGSPDSEFSWEFIVETDPEVWVMITWPGSARYDTVTQEVWLQTTAHREGRVCEEDSAGSFGHGLLMLQWAYQCYLNAGWPAIYDHPGTCPSGCRPPRWDRPGGQARRGGPSGLAALLYLRRRLAVQRSRWARAAIWWWSSSPASVQWWPLCHSCREPPTCRSAGTGRSVRLATSEGNQRFIVQNLRLPRVIGGLVAGGMLGVSGAVMQDTLRNPLAGPELIGVSAGASLAVATIVAFRLPFPGIALPLAALLAGLVTGTVILSLVSLKGNPMRMLLVGAAFTALLNALVIAVITLAPNFGGVSVIYRFLVGSLSDVQWEEVRLVVPWTIALPVVFLLAGRPLNILKLGDEMAEGLGVGVRRTRALAVRARRSCSWPR